MSDARGWTTGDDPQALLAGLVDGVSRALPAAVVPSVLQVERKRSLGDRMAGRPGTIDAVQLDGVEDRMTLRVEGGRLVGEAATVSGGVVIARRTLPLGGWLATFAGQVAALATEAAGDAADAGRALAVLGLAPIGSEVRVDEQDPVAGLAALPLAVAGRLPDPAAEAVARIVALLQDTIPRVGGRGEPEFLVARAATVYLPDTLRAYLALPSTWAEQHRLRDGRTAGDALITQLATLETAARSMHDAALEDDATTLLTNGRFLEDRFRPSRVELQ